ncbi:MAG: response regulator [Gemmatimonadota bacterium]
MQLSYSLPGSADMPAASPNHGFAPLEVEGILAPIHARGDRLMLRFILAHVVIAALLAPINHTWGITIVWAGLSTLAFVLCFFLAPGTFLTRAMAGVVLESFCALHIWQMYGQPEQHFWFFVGFTMMIVYQDWLCMWPGALLIIGQHTLFATLHNMGFDLHFFPEHHVTLWKLFFHFGIAIVHVAVCGYWAWLLRHQTLYEARQRVELLAAQSAMAGEFRERQRAEEERRHLELKMAETQKLESLGVLAGGVAHDFNNILVGILGNASLARSSVPDGSVLAHTLSDIEVSAQRAADLTRQMLAYSGKGQFVIRPVSLSAEVAALTALLPATLAKTTEVRTELAEPSPWIAGDSTQLAQLVMNLAVNGSEALKGRPGTVTIRTGAVSVDAAWIASASFPGSVTPGTYAAVSVSDTGEGMTRETVERVFDPFFSTKFVGRGLGLAAVLGIVRGHRGALRIETTVGTGTVITAIFPLVPAAPRPTEVPRPAAVVPPRSAPAGQVAALVIDDEEVVRALATRILERAGYRVVQASGGLEGLAKLAAHRGEFGVVLLDLSMPDLSGREVLARMRLSDPDLPVVLSSGLDAGSAAVEEVEGHPVRFLQKPYRLNELLEVVEAAVAGGRAAPAPKGP